MRIRHSIAAVAVSLFVTLALAGPALAGTFTVQALDSNGGPPFHFSPSTITIHVGDTVVWHNGGTVPHTATGSGFDSGNLNPGQSYSHTFSSAGTFAYHCQYHQALGMVGTVVVQAASTSPPPGGGGGGGVPPADGSGGALPNTGDSNTTLPFLLIGGGLVVAGGIVLLAVRRHSA